MVDSYGMAVLINGAPAHPHGFTGERERKLTGTVRQYEFLNTSEFQDLLSLVYLQSYFVNEDCRPQQSPPKSGTAVSLD